ncbi:MAG TPA: low molecular weight protein-tyrosine-phosphatase [Bacteroidia bacterium]|jgi:protein-tyrosine phosphatase|nr:low molecular weight protein-tyrosine-phosphatase [Bacteroidia bacterium]
MTKILIVCLGNICRSPLAEGILLHLIKEKNLPLIIDSAGTSDYHIGQAPDTRTVANAKKNKIDLSSLRARQFVQKDFDLFDKIYVMDKSNLQNVLKLARNDADKQKVDLFLNILHPEQNMEVPDPYYGGEAGFQNVFEMVWKASKKLADGY